MKKGISLCQHYFFIQSFQGCGGGSRVDLPIVQFSIVSLPVSRVAVICCVCVCVCVCVVVIVIVCLIDCDDEVVSS